MPSTRSGQIDRESLQNRMKDKCRQGPADSVNLKSKQIQRRRDLNRAGHRGDPSVTIAQACDSTLRAPDASVDVIDQH